MTPAVLERIVLTTGGTGGHIFPALAVAEELKARYPDVDLLFIGGRKGPEGRMAAEAGLRFVGLPAQGVFGRGARALSALAGLAKSLFLAWRELGRSRPQAVLGFGGYASFAAVAAAAFRGIPTAVHEQNSMPGVANRLAGRLARRVFLSFPDTRGDFSPAKTRMTGNPVRASIVALQEEHRPSPEGHHEGHREDFFRVLVLGGSQGAKALNSTVIEALPALDQAGIRLRHQTGEGDLTRVRLGYEQRGLDASGVSAFIVDMAEAYAWADLALCRAGATTVAELAVAGKPAILVPFPHATHDHQAVNARFLEDAGAALMIREEDFSAEALTQAVLALARDRERLAAMAIASAAFARADAAASVVDELETLARKAR